MERKILSVLITLLLITFQFIIFSLPVAAVGTTYYVSTTGNDGNDGSAIDDAHAWLTPQHAATTMVAGDTVYILAGTYNGTMHPANSGNAGNYITFRNYASDVVNINASGANYFNCNLADKQYIQIIGLRFIGAVTGPGLDSNGADYIIIKDCYFTNSAKSGIELNNSTNILIDNCELFETNTTAMNEVISIVTCDTFEIKNCLVHHPVAASRNGIDIKVGCTNGIVHDNNVHDVYNALYVDSRGDSDNISFYNNIVYDTVSVALGINDEDPGTGEITNINFYNNIIYNCQRGFSVYDGSLITFTLINNTFYNNAASGFTEIWIDNTHDVLVDCIIRNNIIVSDAANTYGIWYADYANGGVTVDHNLSYNSGGAWHAGNMLGTNAITNNPLLTNPTTDFSLQTASPARDSGSATDAPATDYDGVSRPQNVNFDIGAFEFDTPTVTTQAATSTEATTATGNGNITDIGGASCSRVGVQWDTNSGAPYSNDAHTDGVYGAGAFTQGMTGLPTGTAIYYRAYATNPAGTSYGAELSFLTKPAAPTDVDATVNLTNKVTITWTKSTGATDYHVWRGINDLGAAGDVATFDDNTADAPTITAGTALATDGTYTDKVVLSLDGASANNGTSYTYKVVASNATGNSANSATDNGYRSPGALTYQWQRSAADSDAAYGNIVGATTSNYDDTSGVVAPDGRYYKCILDATGAAQQTSTVNRGYEAAVGDSAPTVTTTTITNILISTATGGANVTDDGGDIITERGVCISLTVNPSTADTTFITTGTTGVFTVFMSLLSSGTVYQLRGYAVNSIGTGYSDNISFLTKPAAPTNVSATDGTFPDKVVITWTKSTGATDYHLYRALDDLGLVGDVATYEDNGGVDGYSYNYTIVAINATGSSPVSTEDWGYRGDILSTILDPTTNMATVVIPISFIALIILLGFRIIETGHKSLKDLVYLGVMFSIGVILLVMILNQANII